MLIYLVGLIEEFEVFSQYGIAGICVGVLVYLLLRMYKSSTEKDKMFIGEFDKHSAQLMKLQERVLLALENNNKALENLLSIIKDENEKE